mmetsp:Transcript_8047/g.14467  ORF Transcript_8047/g.14467 Transcript_8047/m.14467 type:complete len:271 (-) Transcript_8047:1795-2607(-)
MRCASVGMGVYLYGVRARVTCTTRPASTPKAAIIAAAGRTQHTTTKGFGREKLQLAFLLLVSLPDPPPNTSTCSRSVIVLNLRRLKQPLDGILAAAVALVSGRLNKGAGQHHIHRLARLFLQHPHTPLVPAAVTLPARVVGAPVSGPDLYNHAVVDLRRVHARVGLQDVHLTAAVDTLRQSEAHQLLNRRLPVRRKVVVPKYGRRSRMSQYVGVALLHAVLREAPVPLRAPRVVVLEKGARLGGPPSQHARWFAVLVAQTPIFPVSDNAV